MPKIKKQHPSKPIVRRNECLSFIPASDIKSGQFFVHLCRNAGLCVATDDADALHGVTHIPAKTIRLDGEEVEQTNCYFDAGEMVVLVERES